MLCCANEGHLPLVRDDAGITPLEATGLPLGLFSHTARRAATGAVVPGAVPLAVSRGILEAERDGEEFGLEGAKRSLQEAAAAITRDLCLAILRDAQQFMRTAPVHNYVTALALLQESTCPARCQ